MSDEGPRCETGLKECESFCLLLAVVVGSKFSGAGGKLDFVVDHTPTVWSQDADSIREDGPWTAM